MISDELLFICILVLVMFSVSWLIKILVCYILRKLIIPYNKRKEKKLMRLMLMVDYIEGVKKKNE